MWAYFHTCVFMVGARGGQKRALDLIKLDLHSYELCSVSEASALNLHASPQAQERKVSMMAPSSLEDCSPPPPPYRCLSQVYRVEWLSHLETSQHLCLQTRRVGQRDPNCAPSDILPVTFPEIRS